MRSFSMLPILVAVSAGSACAQTEPLYPPHVEYRSAQAAEMDVEYTCFGSRVRLSISTGGDGFTVLAFENAAGRADPALIAKWNGWLDGAALYRSHEINCQTGDWQMVTLTGSKLGELGTREVTVWWNGSEMGPISRVDRGPRGTITRLPLD